MPRKLTYEEVKFYIESQGYQLLSSEYKNNQTKLEIECPEGHHFHMSYNCFQGRQRCPVCNRQKLCFDNIKEYIESYNHKLISNNYKNNFTKLEIKCPHNHIFYMSYDAFKRGQQCPVCMKKGNCNNIDTVTKNISKTNYTLLSNKYENSKKKLKFICPHNHIFYMSYNNFQRGQRCPICNRKSKSSKSEIEIQQFIASIYNGKILPNNRDTIVNPNTNYNLELDIYLPEINKAIEFNGTYWHLLSRTILYDEIKKDQCKNKNIDLLVIDESNWKNDKNKCFEQI